MKLETKIRIGKLKNKIFGKKQEVNLVKKLAGNKAFV